MREVLFGIVAVSLPAGTALLVSMNDPGEGAAFSYGSPPSLSEAGTAGRTVFRASCATCHGTLAQGTGNGPPLLHPAYASARYSDAEFRAAVREGRPSRLWSFGPMPDHEELSGERLESILAYVRDLQNASGL